MTAVTELTDSLRLDRRLRARQPLSAPRLPLSDGAPVEVYEPGPSIEARLAWLAVRLTIRPALGVGSRVPRFPWPFGLIDFACRALLPRPGTVRATVGLPHATAQLVRA
ncbi:MAG: esterase, partial [Mycobacterium sp.]|nr:esterase [Mycobacterium sp.]